MTSYLYCWCNRASRVCSRFWSGQIFKNGRYLLLHSGQKFPRARMSLETSAVCQHRPNIAPAPPFDKLRLQLRFKNSKQTFYFNLFYLYFSL